MAFSTPYKTAQRDWYKVQVQDAKLFVSDDIVEYGHEFESHLGFYGRKKVMVKRMVRSDENIERMEREYTNLEAFQKHPNILEWVTFDEDARYLYLSQERWSFSLEELVKYLRSLNTQSPQQPPEHLDKYIKYNNMILDKASIGSLMLDLMEQVARGLKHLQEMGYVHRDLNPKNIVIVCGTEFMTAKIANFCTTEDSNMVSRFKHKTISHYHTGFQPQEQINNNKERINNTFESTQGQSKAKKIPPETKDADLFSFGCILFYSLTLGDHPFGASHGSAAEVSICHNKLDLSKCESEEAKFLLGILLHATPTERSRLKISVTNNPVFWKAEKKLNFFRDVSDIMNTNGSTSTRIKSLVEAAYARVAGNWNTLIDSQIVTHIRTDYQNKTGRTLHPKHFKEVRSLIRLIRNQHSHFWEQSSNIQALYMGTLEGMEEYYSGIFPGLLTTVYREVWSVMRLSLAGYPEFKREYYY
ncbi:PREDICTED: serine/threonine-protein kinase/endoribonuclease IRE1b-like [Camelina sativa]|uniref:Serine/threonine-protein kinase/endoribonuclease IRE1b-like n=1 Tax=Camelina sativa TaxID=90675 RepID=A0ABM0Y830_CAMSA|nr:PREDICTED: serine/threonine-protein kinase/endoribonuclease IRE1b-like [Camelina sativa]XP_010497003.1 PREDICTED: serine/threonine-protein kinase/endoribonuclease IRE1b-like [Camelina sativa]